MNVEAYREKLLNVIIDLIENKGVTQFYSGFCGRFDVYCSSLIHELKAQYPHATETRNTIGIEVKQKRRGRVLDLSAPLNLVEILC